MMLAKTSKIINLALIMFSGLISNGCSSNTPFQGVGYGTTLSERTKDGTGSGQHINMRVSHDDSYEYFLQYGKTYFDDDTVNNLSLHVKLPTYEEGNFPFFVGLQTHWSDNDNNGAGLEFGIAAEVRKHQGMYEYFSCAATAQTYLWVGSRDDQLELGAELKVGLELNYYF